ncbi:MAG: POTRA domain-containing protein [Terriglobales bacterium]
MQSCRAWIGRSLLGLLGGAALAAGLRAQSPAAAPVVAIEVEPPPGRSAAEFRELVGQTLGQPAQRAAIRDSLRALYATGEFADVQAVAYPASGGVRLVFATQPNFFVAQIGVEHSPDPPSATELEDASGLTIGQIYTPGDLTQAVAKIQTRLRSFGYYQARVMPQAAINAQLAQASVSFDIQAGPLARVGAVQYSGTLLYPAAQLEQVTRLKSGAALPRARLDAAAAALQAFYSKQGRLTAAVAVAQPDYVAARNQLNVRFDITAGPEVTVATEGFPISSGALRRQVPVYEEHAADAALIEEGRRNLVNYLQERGYFEATVASRRTQVSPDQLRILYAIQPGPKESLEVVLFAGNHYFDVADLSERISVRAASRWPGFVPNARGRFSGAMAQADSDTIAQLYRNNGFASAHVTSEVDRAYNGQPNHIAVTYRISEGPQTLVRHLQVAGVSPANRIALDALLVTAPGQPYAEANLAADRNTILTYYFNAGYQDANCTAQAAAVDPTSGGGAEEDVTFTVQEGTVQTIHEVYIAGNHFVRRNVVAHYLQLQPGAPLSQLDMLQSQRALYDSGLFTGAAVVPRDPGGSERSKDIFVAVNEARRYTFSEGVGLQVQGGTGGAASLNNVLGQTGYSPLLSFDVTRIAFTGRPQTISLRSTYSTLQKRAVLGYDLPDFLNHSNWRADVTTFYDDTFDIRTFRAIRVQGGVQLEQTLDPTLGITYNLDYRHVRVLSPFVAPQEIPILSQPEQVAEFAATLHRDRRDDPLDTHRGTYNSLQLGVAKSFGDGFANFGRMVVQNRWYHPISADGSVVLARSTLVGVELPFGQRSLITITNPVSGVSTSSLQYVLPLPERYLSGGPDSLRGYSINQAGPRDPITGFPVGGQALLLNNIELRFPVTGANLGGVVFYDLGNVYSTPRQMVRALVRWHPPSPTDEDFTSQTLGLGLRYRTPVGPVRFDTGYLLNPPTFQYFTTAPAVTFLKLPPFHFFFSIGQTF